MWYTRTYVLNNLLIISCTCSTLVLLYSIPNVSTYKIEKHIQFYKIIWFLIFFNKDVIKSIGQIKTEEHWITLRHPSINPVKAFIFAANINILLYLSFNCDFLYVWPILHDSYRMQLNICYIIKIIKIRKKFNKYYIW